MTPSEELEIVNDIYQFFLKKCDGVATDMNGMCATVAMNIWMRIDHGKEVIVGGYLTSATGWRRPHWWLEVEGRVYDPMGDVYKEEPGFRREVAHRGKWEDFVAEYRREKGRF